MFVAHRFLKHDFGVQSRTYYLPYCHFLSTLLPSFLASHEYVASAAASVLASFIALFMSLSLSLSWPPPISLSIVRLARMQLFFGTICGLNFFTTAHHHIPLQKREERLLLLPLWLKRMKRRTMKRG
jgi:hypothetical protein